MFKRMGRMAAAYPKLIVIIWAIMIGISIPLGMKLQDRLVGGDLVIPTSESAQANEWMRNHFNGMSGSRLIVVVNREGQKGDEQAFRDAVERMRHLLANEPLVVNVIDPYSKPSAEQLDPVHGRAFIYAELNMSEQQIRAYLDRLKREVDSAAPEGFSVQLTGSPALNTEGHHYSKNDVKTVEKIGLPFVFLLLLFVFRSVIAALLPLLTGISAIVVSMAAAYPFAGHMSLSSLLTNIITMLGLGIAIDYALFMTQRFREELAEGKPVEEAVKASVATAGRSVFFAGATVAVSVVSILFSDTDFARSIALGGTLVVIISVAVSVTLLPAVLALAGTRINKLAVPRLALARNRRSDSQTNGYWTRAVRAILKRPVLYLIVALLPLVSFIAPMLQINLHLPAAAFEELPEGSEARDGMEKLTEHLGPGAVFPIRIVLRSDTSVFEPAVVNEVNRLSAAIKRLPNVKDVQSIASIVTLESDAPSIRSALGGGSAALEEPLRSRAASLVSRDERSTIVNVKPMMQASSPETRELVRAIREQVVPTLSAGLQGSVTGETASGLDYDAHVLRYLPAIVIFVVVLTFVLLYAAFRSVIIPLKAIVMNLLVTAAALGFIVLMYQYGYMPGANPWPLNINTPLTLFVLLFGLSMDYEVILISRMKERYRQTGQHEESVAYGIVSTAGVINGAASIMVVVFGVFVFASFQLIEELGVGLAFAILIDAFIVRTFLVPILMKLMGRVNWWGFRDWLHYLIPMSSKILKKEQG